MAEIPQASDLILYTRGGCCLCEGLEERLQSIDLSAVHPPLVLKVVDIDAPGVNPELKARYTLEVPVLTFAGRGLPRVSPRLSGAGLFTWLQQACSLSPGSE